MARFYYDGDVGISYEADSGEELSPEFVRAAAALDQAQMIGALQDHLVEIKYALSEIAEAIGNNAAK